MKIKTTPPIFSLGMDEQTLEQWLRLRSEPNWMQQFRQEAFRLFQLFPWPTTDDEEWRRTRISHIPFANFPLPKKFTSLQKEPVHNDKANAATLYFSSAEIKEWEIHPNLPQNIIFAPLAQALQQHGELLQHYFMTTSLRPADGKFEAMHGAFWTHGVFLYIPDGAHIARPFRIILEESGQQRASLPHLLIVLGKSASATVVVESRSRGKGSVLRNGLVEIVLQQDADLKFAYLQNLNESSYEFLNGWAHIERDARFYSLFATLGSQLAKTRFGGGIVGPGAQVELDGVYFAHRHQHFDQRTIQFHQAPAATSNVFYKGVVKDKARAVYQGLIRVFKDAQKTNAYQSNKNLSLNDGARADSIPSLEIEANDVRCTHGATVGKLNENALFYLMSRGLSRAEASKLLIQGFLDEVIEKAPAVVRPILHRWLEKKLPQEGV